MIDRRALLAAGATTLALSRAVAQTAEAQSFDIAPDVMREALALPMTFRIGSRSGDVTIVEFFDYNCPWCKQSARDLDALQKADPRVKLILVNYAVLGLPSVLAHKVALGVMADAPEQYAAFHRELLKRRGVIGGDEALAVAKDLGVDVDAITETANSDAVAASLRASAEFGERNNLSATPSWLISAKAYVGHLPLARLRGIVAASRA